MRHTRVKLSRRYISVLMTIAIILLTVILYIFGNVSINRKFPKAEEELYSPGEYIMYKEGVMIKGVNLIYCKPDEYREKYDEDYKGSFDHIIIRLVVLNQSDKIINMAYLNQYFNLVIYPAGYENQGDCICDDNMVASGEEKEILISYNVSEAMLASSKRDRVLKQNIMFCMKAYPVRQAIVFKGIDDYEENK